MSFNLGQAERRRNTVRWTPKSPKDALFSTPRGLVGNVTAGRVIFLKGLEAGREKAPSTVIIGRVRF
jgi:hypothetical protein